MGKIKIKIFYSRPHKRHKTLVLKFINKKVISLAVVKYVKLKLRLPALSILLIQGICSDNSNWSLPILLLQSTKFTLVKESHWKNMNYLHYVCNIKELNVQDTIKKLAY